MQNEQINFSISRLPIKISDQIVEKRSVNKNFCKIHYHDEIEMLYVLKGAMCCEADDEKYILKPGDVLFINSRIPHLTYILEDKTNDILLQFDMPSGGKGALRYISRFLKTNNLPCYLFTGNTAENEEIRGYIMNIFAENHNRNNAYEYYMGANMQMIIALLHRKNILFDEDFVQDKKAINKIMPVIEYVDKNYSEQITLESLSELLNFNKSYFCRLFRSATNSTFTEYLNFVRVCKSEKLLKEGASVSETAYSVGFSSLSYFNRIFKKYKLCSPSLYKKIMSHRIEYTY